MKTNACVSRAILGGALAVCLSCGAPVVLADDDDDDDDDDDRGEPKTVRVDCSRQTIGDALRRHRSRPLVIIVEGTCKEDVLVARDLVTLIAANPRVDGITNQAQDGAAITVSGAHNVVIDGLRIQSAGGGSTSGVVVTRNSDATIQNALIENNAFGVRARWGGFFVLRDSEVVGNRLNGLLLTDSADAWVENCTIDVGNSDGDAAAIGAFRSIFIRLRGDNLVRNSGDDGILGNDDDGTAMEALHMAEVRQDGGHTIFMGRLGFGNLAHASLRDPEIVGRIDVTTGSQVEIRNSSGGPEITGARDMNVRGNSRLSFTRSGITVDVGSINVDQHSGLGLPPGAAVTVAGDIGVFHSSFGISSGSSLEVGGSIRGSENSSVGIDSGVAVTVAEDIGMSRSSLFLGQGSGMDVAGSIHADENSSLGIDADVAVSVANDIDVSRSSLFLGPGSRTDVAGSIRANEKSRLGIDSNAVVNVAHDVDVFVSSSVYVGPGSSLNVAGNLNAGAFFDMNLDQGVSLNVGGFFAMSNFTLLGGGDNVHITGDVGFEPGGRVRLGNDVRYTGSMGFSPDGELSFGSNATINGTINCGGGEVNFASPPFAPHGTFEECTVNIDP